MSVATRQGFLLFKTRHTQYRENAQIMSRSTSESRLIVCCEIM